MTSFRFIDYGCSYKLPSYQVDHEYEIPICGTKGYCTPEMRKSLEMDEKSIKCYAYKQDVFSLGITLRKFMEHILIEKSETIDLIIKMMT